MVPAVGEDGGVEELRRVNQPGVLWSSIEQAVVTSKTLDQYRRGDDPERYLPGVALITEVQRRFDWSQNDVAEALGVGPAVVTRYRQHGVPDHQIWRLQELAEMDPADAAQPRRLRWEQRRRESTGP